MTNSESFFNQLKSQRESQNIEISEICEFTKINSKYILAIEAGDFNILPNVYMRLFLKAYATFIGADAKKSIKDYELYTTGKIAQKETKDNQTEDISITTKRQSKIGVDPNSQISTKQIFTGIFVILSILILLWWASRITKEQVNEIKSNATNPILNHKLKEQTEKNSGSSNPIPNISSTKIVSQNNLPNTLPLNENDFLGRNKVSEITKILYLSAPYAISIKILNDTKINISKTDDVNTTTLINKTVKKGEEFIFDFSSIINFEFWNSQDIKTKLNTTSIDNFLNNKNLATRGSYEVKKSQLYISFYNY